MPGAGNKAGHQAQHVDEQVNDSISSPLGSAPSGVCGKQPGMQRESDSSDASGSSGWSTHHRAGVACMDASNDCVAISAFLQSAFETNDEAGEAGPAARQRP